MHDLLKALWTDDSGQDTTEYVLLVALIALAVTRSEERPTSARNRGRVYGAGTCPIHSLSLSCER
jgi:hypothetical protein